MGENSTPLLSSAPLRRWRADAEKFAEEQREAQCELKAEEARRTGELQASTPEAWDQWLGAALSRHFLDHPAINARFQGVAEGVAELIAELRGRLDANNNEIRKLQLECMELRIKVAELRTDAVLNAMPTASALRGAVN
jgi:hypothetical protein